MTNPEAHNEREFKTRARRRLVGAIALAVALTVVLPMILEPGPRRESSEVAVTIPSPDKAPAFAPVPVPPLTGTPGKALDVRPGQASQPANDVAKTASQPVAPPPEVSKPAEPAAPSQAPAATGNKPAAGKFAVQLAVLANHENANKLQERLQEGKFRVYSEPVTNPGGAVRIRVGPFASRAEADSEAAKLKLAGFSGGVVVAVQ